MKANDSAGSSKGWCGGGVIQIAVGSEYSAGTPEQQQQQQQHR